MGNIVNKIFLFDQQRILSQTMPAEMRRIANQTNCSPKANYAFSLTVGEGVSPWG